MGFIFAALGGAAGAIGRYIISLIPIRTSFPVLTLITNIIGAVLIGFIVGIASERDDAAPNTIYQIFHLKQAYLCLHLYLRIFD